MKLALILPVAMVVQDIAASLVYFVSGDWRHGLYWASAALITMSVIV